MAETENKDDPLKFQEGQRILSKIESLCHKFRVTVGTIVKQVKQDEYDIAIREVTEAQRTIDKRRIDELSRLAETQSRPLTALEKVRLKHLQKMEENEKQSELLSTSFPALLNREIGEDGVNGVDVETVLEDLMNPFVSGVLLEVENLYAVNQSILHLAARCRSEAVHFQKKVKDLKSEVESLKREARENEDKIVRLQIGVRERTDQLEAIRAAHFKEVIAVKEQTIENLKDKTANVEEVLLRGGRGFDPHLLNSLGSDAKGRDLDKAFQDFIDGQKAQSTFAQRDGGATPGGASDVAAVGVSDSNKEGFENSLKLIRMENELTQIRFQLHLLRHGMETWREKAAGLSSEHAAASARAEKAEAALALAASAKPSSVTATAGPSAPETATVA